VARKHQDRQVEASRVRFEKRCDYLNEIADQRNAHIAEQTPDPDYIYRWEVTSTPKLNPIIFPTPKLVRRKFPRPVEKKAVA
jgi:hypothetical protein